MNIITGKHNYCKNSCYKMECVITITVGVKWRNVYVFILIYDEGFTSHVYVPVFR